LLRDPWVKTKLVKYFCVSNNDINTDRGLFDFPSCEIKSKAERKLVHVQ